MRDGFPKPAQLQGRFYAPAYASLESLAHLLDLETSTIRAYVRAGLLPQPVTVGRVKRWDVQGVIDAIRMQNQHLTAANDNTPVDDAYSAGVKNGKAANG